jgi:two-component system phosphate regulon response regulator PhoB
MESILLVEDSKFLRIATERTLTKAGYRVICAGDGEEALLLAANHLPSLIMLDMLLPKLSGPEVLRSLKKDHRTAHIPVLVLSSLSQTNERKLVKEGAAAFLEKGALLDDPSLLLAAIHSALAGNVVASPMATSRPRFDI